MKNRIRRISLAVALLLFTVICVNCLVACEHVHTFVEDVATPATCTAKGKSAGAHCSECGEVLIEQQDLDMIPHTYEEQWVVVTAAGCTDTGLKERECVECGHKDTAVIPALGHTYVQDESVSATLTTTGLTAGAHCSECGDVLIEQSEIPKLRYEDYSYKVSFQCDTHVEVIVFDTQKYKNGQFGNIAYSRDPETGELLKDGKGQVNFELKIDSGYFVSEIATLPDNAYNNIKLPSDSDINRENTYRLTKINGDMVVKISTEKYSPFEKFISYVDETSNEAVFEWNSKGNVDEYKVRVKRYSDNYETDITLSAQSKSYRYSLDPEVRYDFEFAAYIDGNALSETARSTKYYSSEIADSSFPRLEITTQEYAMPTCDYVHHPDNCWGEGIVNNDYVGVIAKLYKNSDIVYDSTEGLDDVAYYTGAKMKIRGNGSAYSEKKPYKLKLGQKVDLLKSLISGRDDGKKYGHKDWLLLSSSALNMKQVAGWSISKALNMGYTPAYSYVALIINGSFNGLYILCESVSKGSGSGEKQSRCMIDDDGYIVELDAYWWNEDLYFETPWNAVNPHYTFKYPDSDDITADSPEYSYIRNYITEFENALLDGDTSYKNYIDEQTFAKWLLAHDIMSTVDAGGANIYLTKKDSSSDSKLKMEILWDFDWSFYSVESLSEIRNREFFYFGKLLQNEEFVIAYNSIYSEIRDTLVESVRNDFNAIVSDDFNTVFNSDKNRWQVNMGSSEQTIESILNYLEAHLNWMDAQISQ